MTMLHEVEVTYKLHPDVRSLNEEWSGIGNPQARRKLQNRLNQRALRRRKLAEKQYKQDMLETQPICSSKIQGKSPAILERRVFSSLLALCKKGQVPEDVASAARRALDELTRTWLPTEATAPADAEHRKCQDDLLFESRLTTSVRALRSDFDNFGQVVSEYVDRDMAYRLPADHLLSLIHYNVFRAFAMNVQQLGLSFDALCLDEYQSRFPALSKDDPALALIPPGLRPTELQRRIPHHPFCDIFPDPVLRDNILRFGEDNLDDEELCLQIFGDGSSVSDEDTSQGTGLIAWSDPASSSGWEVTEKFARNWSWLLKGAFELEASTNLWRAKRGESRIGFA